MRVWDIHPGYLNRQSLLGEHREIHAIHVVVSQGRKGYSRHPETLRWQGHLPALAMRHLQVVAEMLLRGYGHKSPMALPEDGADIVWPAVFVDPPGHQFALLAGKYRDREPGRIPLPVSVGQLVAQHALSALARERRPSGSDFMGLAEELVACLRQPPTRHGLAEVARGEASLVDLLALGIVGWKREWGGQEGSHTTVASDLLAWRLAAGLEESAPGSG
ncbi:MAG: pyrimidine dimer DNA glycosylase/endonuclease V [Thermodesulfobacteriota bacterium]